MRRVACIALPQIRIDIARERIESESPLAVVVAREGGAVQSERDVLGNTRLDVVSKECSDFGIRAGQTVAAARAKCSKLRICVVDPKDVRAALVRIAESTIAFGPLTAF